MTQPITSSQLEQFRRDAKRLAKDSDLAHSQALDQIARQHGFQNWSLLVKHSADKQVEPARDTARFDVPSARAVLGNSLLPVRMNASKQEVLLIARIVDRFQNLVGNSVPVDRLSVMMDIEACHCNGCPLDLVSLHEAARDVDLVHDVAGISRHLNRETGRLEDLFVPRYAARQTG